MISPRAVFLAALIVVSIAFIVPGSITSGQAALLNGLLCRPCIDLITNGENNAIGNFNNWFNNETNWLCSPLGHLKNECVKYFQQYENDFDHFITTDADPRTSCQEIDFCDKPSISPKL